MVRLEEGSAVSDGWVGLGVKVSSSSHFNLCLIRQVLFQIIQMGSILPPAQLILINHPPQPRQHRKADLVVLVLPVVVRLVLLTWILYQQELHLVLEIHYTGYIGEVKP